MLCLLYSYHRIDELRSFVDDVSILTNEIGTFKLSYGILFPAFSIRKICFIAPYNAVFTLLGYRFLLHTEISL
jgi:hypothetical protein